MPRKILFGLCLALAARFVFPQPATAYERPARRPAIVLAAFGTTEAEALPAILNIVRRAQAAFPGYDVHLAFTSNIIRGIWHKRAADSNFRQEHPGIPEEVYNVKNVLSTLAAIQEGGARPVLVQSLHVTDGEEYEDLARLVKTLGDYETMKPVLRPFPWIALGAPALGLGDGQPAYLERAAKALAPLAAEAGASDAALVLMGHGNEHLTQEVFARFEALLRKTYGPQIHIGTVEAGPSAAEIAENLKEAKNAPQKILLAPLMVVAGDHARNDMAGGGDGSWVNIFKAAGFTVATRMKGLGENDSWADIYVEHLKALEPEVMAKKGRDEAKSD